MKTIVAIILLSGFLSLDCARAQSIDEVPSWAIGYWVQVKDEDGRPGDETLEIRVDGTLIVYTSSCQALPPGTLHLHNGNIYATWIAPKGPISLVYVSSVDHTTLTYTSPRTGNNAVYEPTAECSPAEG